MLIFAHIFAGALLGLGFWHLTKDRRAVPLCIFASLLPDLIDKSLGLAFPLVLGGGRTVFHSLMIIGIFLLCVLLFARSRFVLLGLGVSGAILLHQVFDEMWTVPANWFYPLLGPFQGEMIPEYVGFYFWIEMTNLSEWIFMIGTAAILAGAYGDLIPSFGFFIPDTLKTRAYSVVVAVLLITGLCLIFVGLAGMQEAFIGPSYYPAQNVLAGILALGGAVILREETFDTPSRDL